LHRGGIGRVRSASADPNSEPAVEETSNLYFYMQECPRTRDVSVGGVKGCLRAQWQGLCRNARGPGPPACERLAQTRPRRLARGVNQQGAGGRSGQAWAGNSQGAQLGELALPVVPGR
jgi:hypothetical protein